MFIVLWLIDLKGKSMLKIAKFMVREGEEPQMTLTTCYQQEDDQTDHEWETIISFSGSVPGQVQSAQK